MTALKGCLARAKRNAHVLLVTCFAVSVGQCWAQEADRPESRELRWLGHLNDKQSWSVLTTDGMVKIEGTFGGMANDTFFIRGDDDIDRQIPIGALMDKEQKYLFMFEDRIAINLPGANQRRLKASPDYSEYTYRNYTRHRDAIALRRQYNMSKGPARGRTAYVIPTDITGPAVGLKSGTMMPLGASQSL